MKITVISLRTQAAYFYFSVSFFYGWAHAVHSALSFSTTSWAFSVEKIMAFLLTLDLLTWMALVSSSKMEVCSSGINNQSNMFIYFNRNAYFFPINNRSKILYQKCSIYYLTQKIIDSPANPLYK